MADSEETDRGDEDDHPRRKDGLPEPVVGEPRWLSLTRVVLEALPHIIRIWELLNGGG